MKKRPADFDLRSAVHDPSFIPGRRDLPELLGLLESEDDAEAAERALARAGTAGAEAAIARFADAQPPLRARLVKAVARAGGPRPWLLDRLGDADPKTRRNAIVALGKTPGEEVEAKLCEAFGAEERVEHRRSIAASLGKIGGPASLALLRGVETDDPELRRIVDEAVLKLSRTLVRQQRGRIDERTIPEHVRVWFHCRRGLEEYVEDELEDLSPSVVSPGLVEVRAAWSIATLFRARTALRFGFPFAIPTDTGGELEERIALAIQSAAPLMKRLTDGPITYRLEWAGAGHRRAATFRVAREVSRLRPDLANDPTSSLWEIVIGEQSIEVWPKGVTDPRFTYRVADVPASSHPTIAAALARVGGIRRDEVVWDPFVGAGTELIERARLWPYKSLYGCDTDPRAVEATEKNLASAGVKAIVVLADARTSRPPEPVSLVVTNPPMGRRVLDRRSLEPLFEEVLVNARASLRRDGRIVMLSPLFGRSVEIGARLGLRVDRRGAIDLGGFDAELQVFQANRR